MAVNEIVVRSGDVEKVGGVNWEIIDDSAGISFVDYISGLRAVHGVVYLSFGSGTIDGSNVGKVHITTRSRFSLVTAQALHQSLGKIIDGMLKPADKSSAK